MTIRFGLVLMYNKAVDSLINVMSGKSQKMIFTNQDAVMAKTISYAMPNTNYRLYIWHEMQNALKHVNSVLYVLEV